MQYKRYLLLGALLLLTLAWGCAEGSTTIAPPEIRYGEDLCTECNMVISDPRFAAAYVYEVGEGRYRSLAFDDIGDLLVHMAKHPEHTTVAWYVHDYQSAEWLDATTAYYVVGEQIRTPMNHGIAAHATEANAIAMAANLAGEVMDWAALLQRCSENSEL